jgi:hypothetical protein
MSEFNLDSLLDGTLADLKDLPEFKPFPAGTHRVLITLVDKTALKDQVNKHPGFEAKLVAEETMELPPGSEAIPLKKGDETSVLYLLDNDIGQGNFKKFLAAIAEKFGAMTNRELIAEVKNLECLVVTRLRTNKDKTQSYTDIVELQVL